MLRKLLLAACILLSPAALGASNTNAVNPTTWDGVTPHTGTTTGSAQIIAQAVTAQLPRLDCLFINTSSHTEYLDFGGTASVLTIPVPAGQTVTCTGLNGSNTDYISLYDASSGDTYYLLVTILKAF